MATKPLASFVKWQGRMCKIWSNLMTHLDVCQHLVCQIVTIRWLKLAAAFMIHTPPVEDFRKVYIRGSVNFQIHLPSVWFLDYLIIRLSQGEKIFYLEVPNELIYVEFTLPLCNMFLKSSTGGVWNSNGVAQYRELFVKFLPLWKKKKKRKRKKKMFVFPFILCAR